MISKEKAYSDFMIECKLHKEQHIKEVAEYYKGKIPKKLYDAMYRYEVDIND